MTKNESVIEEVTRKMQAMTKPMTAKAPNPTDTKQLMLLAAAEESYSQAATVLQPAIGEALEYLTDLAGWDHESDLATRLQTGLHLLEEAMGAHNRYMDSVK